MQGERKRCTTERGLQVIGASELQRQCFLCFFVFFLFLNKPCRLADSIAFKAARKGIKPENIIIHYLSPKHVKCEDVIRAKVVWFSPKTIKKLSRKMKAILHVMSFSTKGILMTFESI